MNTEDFIELVTLLANKVYGDISKDGIKNLRYALLDWETTENETQRVLQHNEYVGFQQEETPQQLFKKSMAQLDAMIQG